MERTEYLVGNPPAGIYTGDINLGYAFYHVLLDIHARHKRKDSTLKVVGPRFSINAFGKRADGLSKKEDYPEFKKEIDLWVDRWISTNRLRDHLNLSLEGVLVDNSDCSIAEAQRTMLDLSSRGYLIRAGDQYFLDVVKIAKERDLQAGVEGITFFPERSLAEFERFVKENTREPLLITRKTKYSAQNPFGGDNLGPLFVLATIWEGNYDSHLDLLGIGERGLVRYGLLRFLLRMATHNDPMTRNIFCFNRVDPEGGFGAWNIGELTSDPFKIDALRYALTRGHSLTSQRTDLMQSNLDGGRNFVYLVGNLSRYFELHKSRMLLSQRESDGITLPTYNALMDNFKFNEVLTSLEQELRRISKRINEIKNEKDNSEELSRLCSQYLSLLDKIEPFVPAISNKSRSRIVK